MAVEAEVRAVLNGEKAMLAFQPTLDQTLDSIPDGETILFYGIARIDGRDTYYLITHHGVYYRAEESRLFKKQHVSRMFDLDVVDFVDVENASNSLGIVVVHLFGAQRELFNIWFANELSALRSMSAEEEAMRFAKSFGGRQPDRSPFFEGWPLSQGSWYLDDARD